MTASSRVKIKNHVSWLQDQYGIYLTTQSRVSLCDNKAKHSY